MISIAEFQSNLTLLTYVYQKIDIELVGDPIRDESLKEQDCEHYIFADYQVNGHISLKNNYRVKLAVSINQPENLHSTGVLPYKINVEIHGYFDLKDTTTEEEKAFQINISAPSILYGILRELIRSVTSVNNLKGYLLPSVNFMDIAKRKQELEEAEKKELANKKPKKSKKSLPENNQKV